LISEVKYLINISAISACLFYFAGAGVPHFQNIANQELQRYTFEPFLLSLFVLTGLICIFYSFPFVKLPTYVFSWNRKLVKLYIASAGSIIGWGIGTGIHYVQAKGVGAFPLVLGTNVLFMLLAISPLNINKSLLKLVDEKRHEYTTQEALCFFGFVLSSLGLWGIGQWWLNG